VAGTDPATVERLIDRHFRRMSNKPFFRNCLKIVMPEANYGWDRCKNIKRIVQRACPDGLCEVPRLDGKIDDDEHFGFRTTNEGKLDMEWSFKNALQEKSLYFVDDDQFICEPGERENVQKLLMAQLNRFVHVVAPMKDPFIRNLLHTVSGKQVGIPDDLAFCSMALLHWATILRERPGYLNKMRQIYRNFPV
jgi:hypothetical protein